KRQDDGVLGEGEKRDGEVIFVFDPVGGKVLGREERVADDAAADEELAEELVASGDTLRVLPLDLEVVVQIPDDAVAGRHSAGRPYEDVAGIAPEDRGDEDRQQDERTAHGGRAALHAVRLRPLGANDLADLLSLELADEPRREEKAEKHRRDGGGNGAEWD